MSSYDQKREALMHSRVSAGIALCAERWPERTMQIDPNTLMMGSAQTCLLAQASGLDYHLAIRAIDDGRGVAQMGEAFGFVGSASYGTVELTPIARQLVAEYQARHR